MHSHELGVRPDRRVDVTCRRGLRAQAIRAVRVVRTELTSFVRMAPRLRRAVARGPAERRVHPEWLEDLRRDERFPWGIRDLLEHCSRDRIAAVRVPVR